MIEIKLNPRIIFQFVDDAIPSFLTYRDQDIMKRWKDLLDKLEGRKVTLSGMNNLMSMFREIDSIQEELKEVQVNVIPSL